MSTQKIIARQDTNHGEPVKTVQIWIADAAGGNSYLVTVDAATLRLTMEKVNNAGARIAGAGSLDVKFADLKGKDVSARETKACDASGATVYSVVLRSPFYSTPVGGDFT